MPGAAVSEDSAARYFVRVVAIAKCVRAISTAKPFFGWNSAGIPLPKAGL